MLHPSQKPAESKGLPDGGAIPPPGRVSSTTFQAVGRAFESPGRRHPLALGDGPIGDGRIWLDARLARRHSRRWRGDGRFITGGTSIDHAQ